ncbi:putative thiamine transporter SLC35F3 [Chanos chanos]|uniref:Thiamine transporter SLC35F3 n=1 Tax=Chanos chanos TaxID=29144 RepID=A0A6J2WUW4_CHACN|nr:putative thiamine transporter SLC35F3 [Chanos chanos]
MKKLSTKVSPSPCPEPVTLHLPTAQEDGQAKDPQPDSVDGQSMVKGEVEREGHCCKRCSLRAIQRVLWGIVFGGCVAVLWAGAIHSAKEALTKLHAPFFIIWFCSIWNLFLFPVYYLGHVLGATQRQWPATQFRKCSQFLGEGDVTVRAILKGAAPFSVLWSLSGYLYLLALRRISTSDVSAILCCSQAFTFLLSWIGLKDRFMGVRIVAAILSITGIVMLAYADGFHSDSIAGVALGVGSASTSALYKVLFRKRVGEVQPGPASVLLSCVGLCSFLLHSWVCVFLYLTHVEYWPPTQLIPWETLSVMASLLLAFNALVNLGGVLAYPTLISVGILLTIPASKALDSLVISSTKISQVRLAAACVISLGYLLLLLPEDWDDTTVRWFGALWQGGWREDSVVGDETGAETGGTVRPKPKVTAAIVTLA